MTSQMAREVREIPAAVARLIEQGAPAIRAAADAARAFDPALIATVARGSSDHACTYLKYAAELTLGLPVASIGPSVASVYGARLRMGNALCLTVSQSGQSPDIVEMARSAGAGGALTVAVTNHPDAPLGMASQHCLALHAGPEISVAATKTFVNSAVAGLLLIAEWARDDALLAAIHGLPAYLERAVAQDWGALRDAVTDVDSLYTLGRGPAYAMANEAALKFKEVARIHAESYSSAEVLHGPVSIVGAGFPGAGAGGGGCGRGGAGGGRRSDGGQGCAGVCDIRPCHGSAASAACAHGACADGPACADCQFLCDGGTGGAGAGD